jgi:predicted extracellular nuclease
MRARTWFVAAATVAVVVAVTLMQEQVWARSASGIVISEYRFRGPKGADDEFIELFNAGSAPVNVGGWLIRVSANNVPTSLATRATIPANTVIPAGCYYLVANATTTTGFVGAGRPTPNLTYANNAYADDGGVAIATGTTAASIVDQVGQGTAPNAYGEGARLIPANLPPGVVLTTNVERGIERRPGVNGHFDTDNNASDFEVKGSSSPKNADTANCIPQVNLGVVASLATSSVEQGQPLTVFATVSPATVPLSMSLAVTGDLSAVGGSTTTPFADNGVAPDLVANDQVFTAEVNVPAGNPIGPRPITLIATDAQSRQASHTINVNVTLPALMYLPHQIQGGSGLSPVALGDRVLVRGVITGRKLNGFFLQTEVGNEDSDPNSSEGLFVLAGGSHLAAAQVGRVVSVNGAVAELVPITDLASPPITALNDVSLVFEIGTGPLPAPAALTGSEVSDAGGLDQLERFEGMRVQAASLTAVSGTEADGAFYAVLTGQARPFREPGVESGYAVLPCASAPCHVPVFDGNPERLRVDSDGLAGVSGVLVSTGAVMENVTGPLDFESRTFTILPEGTLNPAGGMSMTAAPPAAGDQFTVASLSLGGVLNSDRLAKASSMVRSVLNVPDILGVQDVENFAALSQLAQAIDADATAAGQAAPHYEAQPFSGSDSATLGVLVKTTGGRVSPLSTEPVGPSDLFERPSIMLRATVMGPSTALPQNVTVIVNHLLAQTGSEVDAADGESVREQRKAQAELLADFIQHRQSNDPAEAIVSVGNYNAFSFNDGYVDTVGTIVGDPAAADEVAASSTDLVSPDLVNVTDLLAPWDRYSAISNGSAQALDHVLTTANLAPQFAGVVRPRVNADFPVFLSDDPATPGRLSDRDPMVAYFTFPADVIAPVLSGAGDATAEATGSNGAVVTFATPTATDNLDAFVGVTCAPVSGSLFPLGSSVVVCSAQDAAGNTATESFTITVQDSTKPALNVPAGFVLEAGSPGGNPVSFVVTATDAVTASPTVTCLPASGSVFPLATTNVQCSAADAAGNVSHGSFAVTVRDTTRPTLTLPGAIADQATSPAGKAITFSATASDAVTPTPAVSCTPASGSTFAIGDTVVTCTAADAAGNVATGSFNVSIAPQQQESPQSQPGHMFGSGEVQSGADRVRFTFDVRERANNMERGWVMLQLHDGPGRPDRYLAADVSDVRFSNSNGYAAGNSRRAAADSVSFTGRGWWNGKPGYRFEITACDRGEPGRGRDTFALTVFAPNGQVVATASGVLRDGNIQAMK